MLGIPAIAGRNHRNAVEQALDDHRSGILDAGGMHHQVGGPDQLRRAVGIADEAHPVGDAVAPGQPPHRLRLGQTHREQSRLRQVAERLDDPVDALLGGIGRHIDQQRCRLVDIQLAPYRRAAGIEMVRRDPVAM